MTLITIIASPNQEKDGKILLCWKNDFDQRTACRLWSAPVCWSKYTTNILFPFFKKVLRNVFHRMILTSSTKGVCKTWSRIAWGLLVSCSPFLWTFLETGITVEVAVVALIITLIVVDLVVEGLLAFFMLVKLRFGLGLGIVSVLLGTKVGIGDGWWGVELRVDLVTVIIEAVLAWRSNVSFEWFLLKM